MAVYFELWMPQFLSLIISVTMGIFIIRNNKIKNSWAFLTPILLTFIIAITGAWIINEGLASGVYMIHTIVTGTGVLIINAIILIIYIKRA